MEEALNETQKQPQKRRTRKKTCEIDSLEKLKSDTIIKEPKQKPKEKSKNSIKDSKILKDSSKDITKDVTKDFFKDDSEDLNQTQIPFAKYNITVKKKTAMTAEELREHFDKQFNIDESEKTAKFMTQEDDSSVIFEPMLEDSDKTKSNKLNIKNNKPTRSRSEKINVHKVLAKFIQDSQIEWPTKTDTLCWWCCHSFDNSPIPCPVDYDHMRRRYKVNGVFCSWSCAAAYSAKEYSSLTLLYQMKNDVCGYSENIIRSLDESTTIMISTEGLSYINQDICEIKHS